MAHQVLRRSAFFAAGFVLAFAIGPARPAQAQTRTLFKDIPPSDPKRQVIQSVLDSSFYSMRGQFSSAEWTSGHYGGAWERARQYFPNHAYYVEPGTYFMTHGFSQDGKLFMEVHESAFLSLAVENRKTFTDRSIVGQYARMRASADGREAAAFAEKLGRLETYFLNEEAKKRLAGMLGEKLYGRLLRELRQENDHMFAGALLHEGMHAKMDDDQLVLRIQTDFRACTLPVQWDELRAHMAELNYHRRFYIWATGDIMASWKSIDRLLKELETMRGKPKPLSAADRAKLERIKAQIKAYIALIRLRMREIWQSAQRMNGLMASLEKDYIKPNPPEDVARLTQKLILDIAHFVNSVGEMIKQTELALRALEAHLDLWNEWADCRRPFPPPKTDADKIMDWVRRTPWPTAPGAEEIGGLGKKAGREIGKVGGGPRAKPGTTGQGGPRTAGPKGAPAGRREGGRLGYVISASGRMSFVSMTALNGYLGYLNATWAGDVPAFEREAGFHWAVGLRPSPFLEAGLFIERLGASSRGTLQAVPSLYLTKHGLTAAGAFVSARTGPIAGPLGFVGRAELGYGAATYTEDESGFVVRDRDSSVVWSAAGGLEIGICAALALEALGGYRSASFNGFDAAFFMPGSPPVRLDFSGPFAQAGLSFRF